MKRVILGITVGNEVVNSVVDSREELQPEPLLEQVICLHHRRDGHEAGHPRNDGRVMERANLSIM
jgi:hypothetical protein